jgi:hypothetical protein
MPLSEFDAALALLLFEDRSLACGLPALFCVDVRGLACTVLRSFDGVLDDFVSCRCGVVAGLEKLLWGGNFGVYNSLNQ